MSLQFLTDIWNQLSTSPAWLIIALVLNVAAFLWEKAKALDSRWIPHLTVFGGGVLYWLLGPDVAHEQHPQVFKALLGMLLGFGSWAMHGTLISFLRSKFPGFLPDDNTSANNNDKPK